MKETFTEFEKLQEALKKVNMNEEVMPFVRGKLCESKSYSQMQEILAAPEMIKSHAYILNLDPEQLEEDEIEKVDKLWNLGVNRGFIVPADSDASTSTENPLQSDVTNGIAEQPSNDIAPLATAYSQNFATKKVDTPCWTVLYSACDKNGDIKTGECYSCAINTRSAKADCYAKLERCGYTNVSILAIEAGDPDNYNCDCCQNEEKTDAVEALPIENTNVGDIGVEESEVVDEDDILKNKPHNAHIAENEVDIEEADLSFNRQDKVDYNTLYSEFLTTADDYQQVLEFNDENSQAVKNAFKEVQSAYEDCFAIASPEQQKEIISQAMSYGFNTAADNCTIVEAESGSLDESGNPYTKGMKMSNISGTSSISSTKTKKSASKKAAKKIAPIEKDDGEEGEGGIPDAEFMGEDDDSDNSESSDSKEETKEDKSEDKSEENTSSDNDTEEESVESVEDSNSEQDENSENKEADQDAGNEDNEDNEAKDNDKNETSDEDNSDADSESSEDNSESNEDSTDDNSGETEEDSKDDKESDSEDVDDTEDEESDKSEEDADDEESDEDETEDEVKKDIKEDLTDEEKAQYKNDYKKAFKDTLAKCKFDDKCFDDLTIAEKVTFFKKLNKAWTKNEPKDFMTDKEVEQLNKVVVNKK